MRHYDHVGASFHLGAVFTPSTVTFMDVRAGTSTIARNTKSDAVAQLQAMLNALKFRDQEGKALVVDKLFGGRTEAALKSAQEAIRARAPATVMMAGVLDKPTLLALEAMQTGQMLPDEGKPAGGGSSGGAGSESESAWWQSPWVLGAGALAVVGAVVMSKKPR